MTAPVPPPMLHYGIYLKDGTRIGIVTSTRLRFEDLPKWLEVYEYHPNVTIYYWDTMLRKLWIKTSSIAYVKFVEYVKMPIKEAEP